MKEYTFANLLDKVKTRLGNLEYDDSELLDYLNDAQFEVLGEDAYPFLEKIFTYRDFSQGTVVLPLDFQAVKELFVGNRKIRYIAHDKYFNGDDADKFTVFGGKLFFKGGATEDVDLFYLAKPIYGEMEDEPVIPYEFSEILVLGALYRAKQTEDNYDQAELIKRSQDEMILNMKYRYGLRKNDGTTNTSLPMRKIGRA